MVRFHKCACVSKRRGPSSGLNKVSISFFPCGTFSQMRMRIATVGVILMTFLNLFTLPSLWYVLTNARLSHSVHPKDLIPVLSKKFVGVVKH